MPDEAAKRSYTTRVLVVVCLALVASFAVPMVAVAIPLIASFRSGGPVRVADARGAAVWRGSLYYVTVAPRRRAPLWKSELASDEAVRAGATEARFPWLVATDRELWLFSRDRVERFDGARVDLVSSTFGYIANRPFELDGEPAQLEIEDTRMTLYGWRGGSWVETGDFPCSCSGVTKLDARAVARGNELDLFVELAGDVRHRRAKLGEAVGDPSAWTLLATGVQRLEVAPLASGRFALGLGRTAKRGKTEVEVVAGDDRGVKTCGTQALDTYSTGWGLCSDAGTDRVFLTAPGNLNGDLTLLELGPTGLVREGHPSGGMGLLSLVLWPNVASLASGLLLGLGLAALLSSWMRRLRGDELELGAKRVELASLSRRAVAQLVDSGLQMLPLVAAVSWLVLERGAWRKVFLPPTGPLYLIGFALLAIAWGIGWLGAMGIAEWKTGKTPGKWLCGIRVVSADAEPLGAGRALARNFLEYADAMFHFTVGMAIAALTEKRQRLGDIAARTVVIRDR